MTRESIPPEEQWQRRGLLTPASAQTLGGIALAGLVILAGAVTPLRHIAGHHPVGARCDPGGGHHRVTDRPLAARSAPL
jgi:hypothetical protein